MNGAGVLRADFRQELVLISRRLPMAGQVLVQLGERVSPEQVVAEAELFSGVRWVVPVAERLAIAPQSLSQALLVQVGDPVRQGEILAKTAGQPPQSCLAPVSGQVEQIDYTLGRVLIVQAVEQRSICVNLQVANNGSLPVQLHRRPGELVSRGELLAGRYPGPLIFSPVSGRLQAVSGRGQEIAIVPSPERWSLLAAIPGVVDEVNSGWGCLIRSQAIRLSAAFLLGGEASGRLQPVWAPAGQPVLPQQITEAMAGRILVLNSPLTGETLHAAQTKRVAAIVAGGAHLLELLTAGCSSPGDLLAPVGISVLLFSGFGSQALKPALFSQLASRAGQPALVGGRRPELMVFVAE